MEKIIGTLLAIILDASFIWMTVNLILHITNSTYKFGFIKSVIIAIVIIVVRFAVKWFKSIN